MTNLSDREGPSKPDEEDEDEDVDFNPFLKEIPSPEASSSLSSEIEGLNGDTGDSGGKAIGGLGVNSSTPISGVQNCTEEFEHGEEEVVMQTTVSSGIMCENEVEKAVAQNPKKGTSTFVAHLESGTAPEKGNSSSCGTDDMVGELGNVTDAQKPIMDFDDEEAICKRTRARYSLASFTLDELETFLQETDNEDDLHNVDDEQEYRKFLASVLQGGDSNNQSTQENETADDDEDNDADFEIELEEALESDVDDHINDKTKKGCDIGGRRPETRQNRRQRAYSHCKKKLLSQTKRPLRPILPVLPNGGIPSFPLQDGKTMVPQTACPPSAVGDGYINGFAPYQVGQLHGLIHEHVQLLIQVFSLCVLDPSRQHIASQVQKLIFEMLHKRNEVLTWKTTSYPGICFCAPYICLSVTDDAPRFFSTECSLDSSPNHSVSSNNQTAVSERTSSKGRCDHASIGQVGSFPNYECSFGVPHINRSLLTILDAAPLHLVGKYMEDVEIAVQESKRRHVETSCDTCIEKESLFPLSGFPITTQSNSEVVSASTHSAINTVSSSPSQQPPKKTLAATLVESTKKQSVALVPKEIAKLAGRFFPLFNPALFPHKPPPAAVANRVLFTDSEDELLALGLMEYNTDWKAIQQRFLPCKSKHQIFVRQKNRCSSKAPENPIKAVRRMKTSQLTSEELACIQEGLKVYKHDWISIWRFIVPHRDPSLLPRQWRIAIGTQKSYKLDAAQREKRRLYESKRRNSKVADLARCQNKEICNEDGQAQNSGEENNTASGYTDDAGKSYVHEAFLADWRPNISTAHLWSNLVINPHRGMRPHETAPEGLNSCRFGEATHAMTDCSQQFLNVSKYPRYPSFPVAAAQHSASGSMESNNIVPHVALNTSKPQFYLRPYRARKTNVARLVKLAPGLPPVNLPPSVRIVPQSAFKGPISSVSPVVSAAAGNHDSQPENMIPCNSRMWWFGTSDGMEARQNPGLPLKDSLTSLHTEESRFVTDKGVEEGKTANSDLQMHPLLFQAPEEGCLPYCPLKCSTSDSSSFSFFSGRQPHLNLSLLHNPQHENHCCDTKSLRSKESSSMSLGVDFHPLLQRTDVVNNELASTSTSGCTFVGSGGNYAQLQHPCDAVPIDSMKCTPLALGSKQCSTLEKANKLDLEIHLSSTSKKEKARGRNIITQSKQTSAALDSRATRKTQSSNPLLNQQVENSPNCNGIISGGHTLDAPGNLSSGYLDDMDEQSHPEIVMDQEELSDSDDENEENVEFECEEMADSEAEEESGYEQIVEVLNKEKKLAASDCDEKHCESSIGFHDRANFHTPRGNVPSLELGLTSQGKDDSSNSSWLSIDSSAPHPSLVLDKQEHSTINKSLTVKHLASTRPNRSCKKINPSIMEGMTEKQAKGTAQLNLGPLAIPILRKPRKRVCRTNSSLNTGPSVDKSSCNG